MFALKALNGVVPGFEKAKLRNFGSTIGTRDSRKIMMMIMIMMMMMMTMMMMQEDHRTLQPHLGGRQVPGQV